MTAAGLAIGGVLVLAMIGVSTWGARTLPSDVRIPVHSGLGGYNNFRSKTFGLVSWPLGGLFVYGIYCGITAGITHPHGSAGPVSIIMPAVLLLLVVSQVGAIRAALRTAR
jgi:hypothetical protein